MAGDLHVWLTSALNYSSVLSIGVVLLGFSIMTIFIIRLNGEAIGPRPDSVISPARSAPATAMLDVHNPFSLKLTRESSASCQDGAHFLLSCQDSCRIQCFWGASINSVYKTMYEPWQVLQRNFNKRTLFKDEYIECSQQRELDICSDEELHFKPDKAISEALGLPPRACYPLVVVVVIPESVAAALTAKDLTIVAMVTIVHVRDSVCTGTSHIISQHVKTNHGHLYNLQQLFMSDPVPDDEDTDSTNNRTSENVETNNPLDEDSSQNVGSSTQEGSSVSHSLHSSNDDVTTSATSRMSDSGCVVCQTNRVTRVILPCRHACLCDSCFRHFEQCPMCRGYVNSYFSLDGYNHEDNQGEEGEAVDPADMGWMEWWIEVNIRINRWFGFV